MPLTANISISPKVMHLKKRNQHLINLIMEKVAGHLKDEKKYPLPADANSPERAVFNLVKAVSKRRRDKFIERSGVNLNATSAKRKQLYDELNTVNLQSAAAITEQVKRIEMPAAMQFTKEDAEVIKREIKEKAVKPAVKKSLFKKSVPQQAVAATIMRVTLENLTCNKKSEIRRDEISIGATGTDSNGLVLSKDPVFVGKFKKGDSIAPGATGVLFEFPLDSSVGGTFPLVLSASLFLLEEDWIHNRELSDKLSIACFAIWGACMAATGVIIAVGMLGGPVTVAMAYIAIATGMTFLAIGTQLLPLITDDVSDLVTDLLVLDVPPNVGDIVNRTITMEVQNWGGDVTIGNYIAALKWEAI